MRWMSSSSSISRNNQYKRLNFLYSESLFDLIWQSDSWDTKHQCIFNEIKRMSELTEFACDTTSSRMLDLSISSFVIRRLVSYIIWNVLLFFPSFTLKGPIWYILFLGDLFLSLEKTTEFPCVMFWRNQPPNLVVMPATVHIISYNNTPWSYTTSVLYLRLFFTILFLPACHIQIVSCQRLKGSRLYHIRREGILHRPNK